jgi:type IV pilus assembly protein PilF
MTKTATCCAILLMVLALGACTTTNSGEKNKPKPEKAAQYNAQLAVGYMRQGRMNLARKKLSQALKQAPHSPVVHNSLALYYIHLKEYDKADKQYKLSLRYKPGDPQTLNNYGAFLCSHGKPRQSLDYFKRAADDLDYSTPDSALANAGMCAQKIPDEKLAEKYFKRALAVNSNQTQALWQLGLIAFKHGRYGDAHKYFVHLTGTRPKPRARALWMSTETAWIIGKRSEARRYGRKLLKLYPDSNEARKFIQLLGGS